MFLLGYDFAFAGQQHVLLCDPLAGQLPFSQLADCASSSSSSSRSSSTNIDSNTSGGSSHIVVKAGQSIVCPFAVQLANSSAAPVIVQGQALLVNGPMLSSSTATAMFSSSNNNSQQLELGRCAVLTDTFLTGGLFLGPSSIAAGTKMPTMGAGGAVCGSVTTTYKAMFGPYASDARCGAFKVGDRWQGIDLPTHFVAANLAVPRLNMPQVAAGHVVQDVFEISGDREMLPPTFWRLSSVVHSSLRLFFSAVGALPVVQHHQR